jgi:hypothetical protein
MAEPTTQFRMISALDAGAEALRGEVVEFWRAHHALPPGVDPLQRVQQVVAVAKGAGGRIAGVISAYKSAHAFLAQPTHSVRAFVAPEARRHRLSLDLTDYAKRLLEARNALLPAPERTLGLLGVMEAEGYKTGPFGAKAVWTTGMTFIGRDQHGSHVRVNYFDGAELIGPESQPSAPAAAPRAAAEPAAAHQLVHVWGEGNDALREEVVAFWQRLGALPAGTDAAARARQAVVMARAESGRVMAVATTYKAVLPRLEHPMYHLRAMVAPQARGHRLASDLGRECAAVLEQYEARLPVHERALGVCAEIQSNELEHSRFRRGVRWASGMVYIGRLPQGHQLRVRYFDGAELEFATPKPASTT